MEPLGKGVNKVQKRDRDLELLESMKDFVRNHYYYTGRPIEQSERETLKTFATYVLIGDGDVVDPEEWEQEIEDAVSQ